MTTKADIQTVRIDRLHRQATSDLIGQYDKATSTYAGRLSNKSPRQRRINHIVDLLSERADWGDTEALAWLRS